MRQVRTQQGDTIDAVCWRYYGYTAGITEAVLQANPQLDSSEPILPHGTLLTLPPEETATATEANLVQLWD
ncbi:MAG: tail protein X [Marinobacterium sp.]|nr:tail protein X [Marinobacterium sp.]